MRRLILVTSLLFLLTGCAALGNQKANWEACQQDPECLDKAKAAFVKGQVIGSLAGGLAPIPGAGSAGGAIGGGVAFLIAMLAGGAALRKKKESEDVEKHV